MLPIKKIASYLALFSLTSVYCQDMKNASVLVCYGDINPDKIQGFNYVILESEHYNAFDVKLMKESNQLVLGYISVGEVSPTRHYYAELKDKTIGKNEIWDSHYLDLADPTTQEVLMAQVDKIQKKGFNGLFLDTVDAYGPWGTHPDKAGAYVNFISMIKDKYPDFHLMQNSALAITNRSKDYINSVALESVATEYNFEKSDYRMRKMSGFHEKVSELKKVRDNYNLPIVLIEYADSKGMFNKVKGQLASLDFEFFIGNIGLEAMPKFK